MWLSLQMKTCLGYYNYLSKDRWQIYAIIENELLAITKFEPHDQNSRFVKLAERKKKELAQAGRLKLEMKLKKNRLQISNSIQYQLHTVAYSKSNFYPQPGSPPDFLHSSRSV